MNATTKPNDGQIILYRTSDGAVRVEVLYQADTFWLIQKQLSELFDVDVRTVNEHLQHIYKSEELPESSTIRKFRIVRREGKRDVAREIDFYNLDATISVGYRVNSAQVAKQLAEEQYDGFRIAQDRDFEGDFEKEIKRIESQHRRTKGDDQ
ncbi:MAG: hypothetical protein HKL96_03240 [Phycisphaerales bacterium]|nr:hypothetical protein [Phycisphaerales bacterium]